MPDTVTITTPEYTMLIQMVDAVRAYQRAKNLPPVTATDTPEKVASYENAIIDSAYVLEKTLEQWDDFYTTSMKAALEA